VNWFINSAGWMATAELPSGNHIEIIKIREGSWRWSVNRSVNDEHWYWHGGRYKILENAKKGVIKYLINAISEDLEVLNG